ncbi:hypothetical protein GR183_14240 [Stappia sp. GBMRC 2046]|uniref:Flavodoxin domain-containing protein n=1 Tax=Stappia sediminis TaxID=2692190 RepID=A0A7X3LVZ5_9HYPH|nr:flavodoxin domain-containing protein [Stappia sediminis]MXN66070.1 hypothetical protein [Stappia sediminis]
MVQVLVAYASTEGQTRKIVERIAARLRDHGAGVQLVDVAKNGVPALERFPRKRNRFRDKKTLQNQYVEAYSYRQNDAVLTEYALEPFDAALLAGSLHAGRHQKELIRFVKSHREALCGVPTGFVSVSLSAHGDTSEDVAAAHRCVAEFFEKAGWEADCTHLAAGAVRDARLGFIKRWILHAILRAKGVEMGPSGELEFTDWAALDAFADQFLKEEIAPQGGRNIAAKR